jgi:hypothetical protein
MWRSMNETAVGRLLHERGWRTAFTVEQMVSAWGQLVAMVERGYDDSIYEYLNDLSCRDWVYDAWQLLSDDVTTSWTARLEHIDERFRRATDHADEPLITGPRADDPARWWWRRRPRLLTGELAADLRGDQPAG